jgi:hypothetical protein
MLACVGMAGMLACVGMKVAALRVLRA